MFKSKLQEVCQKKAWPLPEYNSTKEGLDHDPRFSASVTVNGLTFNTAQSFRSSKLAQNDAARIAFDHFSNPPPPPLPFSTPAAAPPSVSLPVPFGFPQPSLIAGFPTGRGAEWSCEHTPQKLQEPQKTVHAPQVISSGTACGSQISGRTLTVKSHNSLTDVQHLHKNQLQYYAQKRNLLLPVYSCEREGPPHATRFKCSVTIDGQTYQGQEFLPTLKDAEHAAAKIALISLMPNGVQEDDSGLYKNLLQEILQKEGQHVPLYSTKTSGEPHMRNFVSTVEIGGEYFTGQVARSKKLAEVSAAKVAYNTLRDRKSSQIPLFLTPNLQGQEGSDFISSNAQPAVAADRQQQERPMAPNISVPNAVTGERQSEISGGSTSSGTVHGQVLKSSPSASPATQHGSLSTLASDRDSDMNSTLEPPAKRKNCKTCTVYSQTGTPPTLPEGCTVHPISDENSVAVLHEVKKSFNFHRFL